jgi:AcrR family transcriptional regulator
MKSGKARTIARPKPRRGYRQGVRAEQAKANCRAILEAAVKHLRQKKRLAETTLEEIAAEAGVTVRTILRQFGSKDGIMKAAFFEVGRQIELARPQTAPGDVDAALAALLRQYEQEGDLNARVVAEEYEIPFLHRLLEYARKSHRQWLTQVFGPRLSHLTPAEQEQRITALYAATEVQLWKLLRRDLHQTAEQTAVIFEQLVRGVLAA